MSVDLGGRRPVADTKRGRKHLVELGLFIMVMETYKPFCPNLAPLAQQASPTGILGKHHIGTLKHIPGTGGKITRVAKRRRNYP